MLWCCNPIYLRCACPSDPCQSTGANQLSMKGSRSQIPLPLAQHAKSKFIIYLLSIPFRVQVRKLLIRQHDIISCRYIPNGRYNSSSRSPFPSTIARKLQRCTIELDSPTLFLSIVHRGRLDGLWFLLRSLSFFRSVRVSLRAVCSPCSGLVLLFSRFDVDGVDTLQWLFGEGER